MTCTSHAAKPKSLPKLKMRGKSRRVSEAVPPPQRASPSSRLLMAHAATKRACCTVMGPRQPACAADVQPAVFAEPDAARHQPDKVQCSPGSSSRCSDGNVTTPGSTLVLRVRVSRL